MSGEGCNVARRLFSSRYELYAHPNYRKSAVVVAIYHHKSIDLLFIINDRFRWLPNCERSGQKEKSSIFKHVVKVVQGQWGSRTSRAGRPEVTKRSCPPTRHPELMDTVCRKLSGSSTSDALRPSNDYAVFLCLRIEIQERSSIC